MEDEDWTRGVYTLILPSAATTVMKKSTDRFLLDASVLMDIWY